MEDCFFQTLTKPRKESLLPSSLKPWLGGQLKEDVPVFMKDGSIETNNVPRITLQGWVGGGRERGVGVKHNLIRMSITHTIWCVSVWFRKKRSEDRKEEERKWGDWKARGRREGGEEEGREERSTLCSISSSDLICLCSSTVASRASTFTAMMILDGW